MNTLDMWAALASAAACLFLGLRAQMLKPGFMAWPNSPTRPRLAIFGLSVVMGGYCAAVIDGYDATLTEAVLISCLALTAFELWRNLNHQRAGKRRADAPGPVPDGWIGHGLDEGRLRAPPVSPGRMPPPADHD